ARGGRGRDLRAEIALQRSALARAQEKLAGLSRERERVLERLAHIERAPARERRPLAGRALQPEQQLGLDLGL
ncbi:MAG: hypothetical protein ACRDNE_09530, partial [Gaiellaceae bacterium]